MLSKKAHGSFNQGYTAIGVAEQRPPLSRMSALAAAGHLHSAAMRLRRLRTDTTKMRKQPRELFSQEGGSEHRGRGRHRRIFTGNARAAREEGRFRKCARIIQSR
ncbi:hypothetical protein MTO96_025696 [Rhipicephalus appendiculatus]